MKWLPMTFSVVVLNAKATNTCKTTFKNKNIKNGISQNKTKHLSVLESNDSGSGAPKSVLKSSTSIEKEVLSLFRGYSRALIQENKRDEHVKRDNGNEKPFYLDARDEYNKYIQIGWKANLPNSKDIFKEKYKLTIDDVHIEHLSIKNPEKNLLK